MTNNAPSLLLASSSPYRRALLAKLGLPFDTASPDIDETPLLNEPAEKLVARLAEQKAQALAAHHPDAVIIGSDQVAEVAGNILGKPGDYENAFRQLKSCSGKIVTFYTGLSVHHPASRTTDTLVSPFEVGFRQLSDEEIKGYIEKETPFNCAGSFKSEGLGIALFSFMRGDDPNSLVGLPLIELLRILKKRYAISPLTIG